MRRMMERLDPAAAALETTRGGPALPMRPSTAGRYLPYYRLLGRKGLNKVSGQVVGRPLMPLPQTFGWDESGSVRAAVAHLVDRGTLDWDRPADPLAAQRDRRRAAARLPGVLGHPRSGPHARAGPRGDGHVAVSAAERTGAPPPTSSPPARRAGRTWGPSHAAASSGRASPSGWPRAPCCSTTIVAARVLGPDDFGFVSLAVVLVLAVCVVADAGASQALVYLDAARERFAAGAARRAGQLDRPGAGVGGAVARWWPTSSDVRTTR